MTWDGTGDGSGQAGAASSSSWGDSPQKWMIYKVNSHENHPKTDEHVENNGTISLKMDDLGGTSIYGKLRKIVFFWMWMSLCLYSCPLGTPGQSVAGH